MGTSNFDLEIDTSHPNYTMKLFLLAIALAAVSAEPESKPYYYGGYGGYGLGYGGYGHFLGKRSAEAEAKPEADPWIVGYYPYGNGYAIPTLSYHLIGKRSADAKQEIKPYYYGGPYGGYGGYGLGYGHLLGKRSAEAEPESKPYYYGGLYGGYGGYGLGYYGHYLGKRSAEAEPESKPYYYGGLYGGYGGLYGGYYWG